MSFRILNGQQEKVESSQMTKTLFAVVCLSFLSFIVGLKLTVGFEMSICSKCSTSLIYDPLVIADAATLVLAFLGVAYFISGIRAQASTNASQSSGYSLHVDE